MIKWRIYYDDYTTVDREENIRPFGVAFIAERQNDGRIIHQRSSYYLLTDDGWIVVETDGLIDWMLHKLGKIKRVIMGRSMTNNAYWALYEKVKNDEL